MIDKKITIGLIFLLSSIVMAIVTIEDSTGTENSSFTVPLSPVTELNIGWPPIAHLAWDKGYLEFKSKQPTKAAKEFFNVYLKDLVDSYIADQCGRQRKTKKK